MIKKIFLLLLAAVLLTIALYHFWTAYYLIAVAPMKGISPGAMILIGALLLFVSARLFIIALKKISNQAQLSEHITLPENGITFTARISYKDYLKMNLTVIFNSNKYLYILIPIVALPILLLSYHGPINYQFFFPVIGVCLLPALTLISIHRNYKKTERHYPTEYVLGNETLSYKTPLSEGQIKWEVLRKVKETKNFILLYYANTCLVLKNRNFQNNDLDTFKAFIRTRV